MNHVPKRTPTEPRPKTDASAWALLQRPLPRVAHHRSHSTLAVFSLVLAVSHVRVRCLPHPHSRPSPAPLNSFLSPPGGFRTLAFHFRSRNSPQIKARLAETLLQVQHAASCRCRRLPSAHKTSPSPFTSFSMNTRKRPSGCSKKQRVSYINQFQTQKKQKIIRSSTHAPEQIAAIRESIAGLSNSIYRGMYTNNLQRLAFNSAMP